MMLALKQFYDFLGDLIANRGIIAQLTTQDFKTRYLGSYLGLSWAFLHPVIYILIFWFVFDFGFKSRPVNDYPFIIWLTTGMIPWLFFSDSLTNATYSIMEQKNLVKHVVFRVSSLPIVKIFSALYIHLVFVGALLLMIFVSGFPPSLYHLQVVYYLFALMILLLGLSWMTASLVIFLRDVSQVISVLLQFGFWLTPIFWPLSIIPEGYRYLIKLNPVYYITEGYRDAFIHKVWFWEHPVLTLYYWTFTMIVFVFGALLFRRLRPHFADVL